MLPAMSFLKNEVLTLSEMRRAEEIAIEAGTPGIELMRNAGRFCFESFERFYEKRPMFVLCGPGNNGGDGFIVARLAEQAGWPVRVALLTTPDKLEGDARLAYESWLVVAKNPVLLPFTAKELEEAGAFTEEALIVDALFGTGLNKEVTGEIAKVIEATHQNRSAVVSIDVPSGLNGETGQILGCCFRPELTVTFFRKKLGHLIYPGAEVSGMILVGDIGIEDEVLDQLQPAQAENHPDLWDDSLQWPTSRHHKYERGHTIVVSGGTAQSGAARLAARGALRIGSGLVSVASPSSAVLVNAARLDAVMVKPFHDLESFEDLARRPAFNSFVIGPGNGVGEETRDRVRHLLSLGRCVVLDADALTSFEEDPDDLFRLIEGDVVMTPHHGEFRRLFPDLSLDQEDRLSSARAAAVRSGAIVILKGPDTLIAHPEGQVVINTHASPFLATAGSGDVLAGFIAGLMANHVASFAAACAAVWLHGEAGLRLGPGLISEDLPETLPEILGEFYEESLDP